MLSVSQKDVAALAGLSLESVKKPIRIFQETGIIFRETGIRATSRRRITIVDRERLSEIAAGEQTATA